MKKTMPLLALVGCTGLAATDVNAPGPWQMSFLQLIDNPDGSITTKPETAFPDRVAELPAGIGACDPGGDCAYTPAYLQPDDVDHIYADFTETFASHVLSCIDIEFTSADAGFGVCVDRKPNGQVSDRYLGRYSFDLARVR